jgi:hypothetical protein
VFRKLSNRLADQDLYIALDVSWQLNYLALATHYQFFGGILQLLPPPFFIFCMLPVRALLLQVPVSRHLQQQA